MLERMKRVEHSLLLQSKSVCPAFVDPDLT